MHILSYVIDIVHYKTKLGGQVHLWHALKYFYARNGNYWPIQDRIEMQDAI